MYRTAARLLVVILAVAVTPLDAASVLSPAHRPGGALSTAEALAALPESLSAPEFFAAVNHTSGPGYAVGGAQGSQHMVITISISVPGDLPSAPAAAPGAPPLDPGQYAVDSFFDIFTDVPIDGGLPAGPPTPIGNALPTGGANVDNRLQDRLQDNFSSDSFFDISTPVGVDGSMADPGGASSGGGATSTAPSPGSTDFVDSIINGDHKIDSRFLRAPQEDDRWEDPTGIWEAPSLPTPGVSAGVLNAERVSQFCESVPTAPPCGQAGAVFETGIELLESCSSGNSAVCDTVLPNDLLREVAPGTYILGLEGFGEATGDGLYTLNIEQDTLNACAATPTEPGCSGFLDLAEALGDLSVACDGSDDELCDRIAGLRDPNGDDDWYSFTLDAAPPVSVATTPPDPAFTDVFYDLEEFAGCQAAAATPDCSAAGLVFVATLDLLNTCGAQSSRVCDLLLPTDLTLADPGTYYVVVDAWDGDAGPYTLTIGPETASTCAAGPETPGCSELTDIVFGAQEFDSGCAANPSPVCLGGALASEEGAEDLDYVWTILMTGGPPTTPAAAANGRSFTILLNTEMTSFQLRETGDNTGVFEVISSEGGEFRGTLADHLNPIFAGLPPRSTVVTSGYRIKQSPDGNHLLFYDDDGAIHTTSDSREAPTGTLVALTPDLSDPTKVIFSGGGKRIVIPVPGVPLLSPRDLASTAEEISDAAATGGVAAVATAKGGSSGPVFDMRILNFGKTASAIEGVAIFEPLEGPAADAVRNTMLEFVGAVNSVENGPADAYCVEQDKGVPTGGQLFAITNAGKQKEFAFAVAVLAGGREVEAAGLLNPDSDAIAYTHSILQWAIWTVEKKFDKEGYARSFVEQTKKTWPGINEQRRAAGLPEVPWTQDIEDAILSLVNNRWEDIQRIIGASDLPV